MEDDDDLELLRLAALKSLKKDVPATKPANNLVDKRVIPVVSNVRVPVVDKFYAPGEPQMVQPNLIHHPVPPYINSGFEKMEINEPYMPQRLNPSLVVPYNEFAPPYAAPTTAGLIDPTTNVQLSPRSAAFVFENKQIIKRRQGLSPQHSPGRWSRSPSPENWKYRRSNSRSPAYPSNSPHFRNRSVSRSPQRRRHSPQPAQNRRNRTRSPAARQNFDGSANRPERRSPVPNRRANSPNNRHPQRQWRGHSPKRDNGLHARKSDSPRGDEAIHRRRRTRSPTAKSDQIRKRSSSRSPIRKFPRNNVNRPPRRSPHSKRFNNGNKPGHSGPRNRNHIGRSGSLHRSHSPQNHQKRRMPAQNTMENGESSNKTNEKEMALQRNEKPMEDLTKEQNAVNENDVKEKIEKDIEDGASSDSEHSDSDGNDGIDLFASEESESENEGRFKLSSCKSERKANVPIVSFSELGKMAAAPADAIMRDLDELQTDSVNARGRGGPRRDNDRNRNRRDDRRPYNRERDRDNRERERDRDRERNRDRERVRERERESSKPKSSGSWKNSKTEESRRKDESNNDVKGEKKPNSFKSTFTSVDSESRTKTPDGGKIFI